MKISIFGTGYVGLVTGACLADLGNYVLCCDIDRSKISKLKKGEIPFYEPGLSEVVGRNIKEQRLSFTTDAQKAVVFGEALFIAVGTPSLKNGDTDLKYINAVVKSIGQNLNRNNVVVVTKSTIPVGTSYKIKKNLTARLKSRRKNFKFAVVNNPEFLRQGKAVNDFNIPDRLVVGVEDGWAKKIIQNLFSPYTKNGHSIYFMDCLSSELTKYAANTFIAARISLINEIAQICEHVGADIESVRAAVGADKRIGQQYLYPGVGYGGSCFPKDIRALAGLAKKLQLETGLIGHVEFTNEKQKESFGNKIINKIGNLAGKKIAVWGLSFKPQTDDMRCAPSIKIINMLLEKGAQVTAFDPAAGEVAQKIFSGKIDISSEMYAGLKGADCLVMLTEWPQFKEPDFKRIKLLLKRPIIFDGRNIYEPQRMKDLGFSYIGVGRKTAS